jgi:hypothetical protein
MAALCYCCAIAILEVSEFQQLPHGAITPQYNIWISLSARGLGSCVRIPIEVWISVCVCVVLCVDSVLA